MLDYIAVLKGMHDGRRRRGAVDEAIVMMNLDGVRKSSIGEYSFGMRKRLGIAQALLGGPRILILDEPMEGLDPGESTKLAGLIASIADRRLVIISTHSLSNFEFGCSTLLVLRQGKMLYSGTPAGLAGYADGLTWQVEADGPEMEQIKADFKVVGVQQKEGKPVARVLSYRKPPGKASAVKARLGEGYLALMGTEV